MAVIGITDERAGELPLACVVKKEAVTEKEIVDFVASKYLDTTVIVNLKSVQPSIIMEENRINANWIHYFFFKYAIKMFLGQISDQKRLRGGVRFVEKLPKSESGKILRRLLKEEYEMSKS